MQSLSHAHTPPALDALNSTLLSTLRSDDIDTETLQSLIDQRHELIVEHLASLDADAKKQFVESETHANDYLNTVVVAMFKESSNNLYTLRKGLQAVAKYKQSK